MSFDTLLANAKLPGPDAPLDIAFKDGRIAAIGHNLGAAERRFDLGGRLVVEGLVETHIHLDKSCLLTRLPSPDGTLKGAIDAIANAKPDIEQADIYARGQATLERAILAGTNLMRTHVEVDPRIGKRGFEAVRQLQRDYRRAVDLEVCVFPQEGLINDPGCAELLIECLEEGAEVLGGCPYTDSDPKAHLAWVFDKARHFDVDIDLHLDFDLDPSWMALDTVLELTERFGMGGRVVVGHVTKLSMLDSDARLIIARRMASAGVAMTVLPATDLFLMGRGAKTSAPRGVAPIHEFRACGVACSIATNNVMNAFTPYGDCSLTRIANLYGHIAQIGEASAIERLLDLISKDARSLLRRANAGIVAGAPATCVVLDAPDGLHAVAQGALPLLAFKDGRQTVERQPARLCD